MRFSIRHTALKGVAIIVLFLIYYGIGYELERHQFELLFSLYTAAFALSYYLHKSGINLKNLIALSFGFKAIFLFSIPELSQDFYRFLWDGMLVTEGINPYLHLPVDLIKSDSVYKEILSPLLFEKMGELSQNNYSTYPPIAQLMYSFTYSIAGGNLLLNVVILRLIQLLAEMGLVYYSLKILEKIKLPKQQVLFFVLNPMVILESTFSLHFEVVMLFFLVLSLYYLYTSRIYISALGLAAAVASKLMPLMFLPLLVPVLNKKSSWFNRKQIFTYLKFIAVFALSLILVYSFLWNSELLTKNIKTLSLYFTSFEFNASFYYGLRWIGYQWKGYNMIGFFGKVLAILSLVIILYLSFKKKNISFKRLLTYMLITSTAYYLCSTTVHPWYLMLPLLLSVFTTYKYMLVWSFVVFLSYSAYTVEGVEENYWLLVLEYVLVIFSIGYEVYTHIKSMKTCTSRPYVKDINPKN